MNQPWIYMYSSSRSPLPPPSPSHPSGSSQCTSPEHLFLIKIYFSMVWQNFGMWIFVHPELVLCIPRANCWLNLKAWIFLVPCCSCPSVIPLAHQANSKIIVLPTATKLRPWDDFFPWHWIWGSFFSWYIFYLFLTSQNSLKLDDICRSIDKWKKEKVYRVLKLWFLNLIFTLNFLIIRLYFLIWKCNRYQLTVFVLFQDYFISSSVQSLSCVQLSVTQWTEHASLPCPLSSPGVFSVSCPLSQWCHPTISSSVIPFFSCLQFFPASGSFPMSQLFASGGQSIGVSASASVLPMNIQDWFPLGMTGLISLQSKELSRVFSNTTVWRHHFFGTQLSLCSNSHIHTWLLEKP